MRLCILFGFLVFSQIFSAQTFTEVVQFSPLENVESSSVAFSDVDGDGDQDVFITGENVLGDGISKLYFNDGMGNFTEKTGTPFEGFSSGSVSFSDVDGDGDEDLLITGFKNRSIYGTSKLYSNDGEGNFTEKTGTPFDGVSRSSVAFSDVDGDGDEDVLITGANSSFEEISKLYINDGMGNFTEKTGTPFEGVGLGSVAFSDVDGDGDEDVLITGWNISDEVISKLYTNDGVGNFTEKAGTPFEGVGSGSVAFSDVDGDGDEDVLITGRNSSEEGVSKLYFNDGMGNFTEMAGTPFDEVKFSSVAFSDMDRDGDDDLLISGRNNSDKVISKLYTNNGSGNFTKIAGTPFEGVNFSSVGFLDVNGDGSKDVLITGRKNLGYGISKLYINEGSGNFREMVSRYFDGLKAGSVAFSDVDGDGDEDVLITGWNNSNESVSKLYTNDGAANFTEMAGAPFEDVRFSSVAFSDVDGDGDEDLLITGQNNSEEYISELYINDASGNFNEMAGTPFEGVKHSSVAFSDVDGDGDQDVLITGENSSERISKLYVNDGAGNFTEIVGTPFDGVTRSSVAFSDVDGDGDEDVLITGEDNLGITISKLYTNDGSGNFSGMPGIQFQGVSESSVAFSDIDGDGDEDVLITGMLGPGDVFSKMYTNDGSGNFTQMTGTPFEGVKYSSVAFSDVDGDGDEDVVITGLISSANVISKMYTNDGMGNFTEIVGTPFKGVRHSSVAFSDVDGDGDEDVLIMGQKKSIESITKLYTNDRIASSYGERFIGFKLNIRPYPNPVNSNKIHIDFDTAVNGLVSLKVYNLNGHFISEQTEFAIIGHQVFTINIANLPSGSYFIHLIDGKRRGTAKFIVE